MILWKWKWQSNYLEVEIHKASYFPLFFPEIFVKIPKPRHECFGGGLCFNSKQWWYCVNSSNKIEILLVFYIPFTFPHCVVMVQLGHCCGVLKQLKHSRACLLDWVALGSALLPHWLPQYTLATHTCTHAHTENNLHTSLWSQRSLSAWTRVAQTNTNWLPFLQAIKRTQKDMHTKCSHL